MFLTTRNCEICHNHHRDHTTVCLVETIRDVIAIENTNSYKGVYHVLGGIISPIDGIGPEKLNIPSLVERIKSGTVKEVIMAINPTYMRAIPPSFISAKSCAITRCI